MKVKPALLLSCLSAMALLDYAITVCICGLVGRVVVEELRPLREEMRMVGGGGESSWRGGCR